MGAISFVIENIRREQMIIGILADTHIVDDSGISELPNAVIQAFQGADAILHLGDLGTSTKALDDLEAIAPLSATLGGHNPEDDRVTATKKVVNAGDVRIGMVFDLETLGLEFEFVHDHDSPDSHRLEFALDTDLPGVLESQFGQRVDVVAFAATHASYFGNHQGVQFINPGSPTIPEPGAKPDGVVKRTIAFLDIEGASINPRTLEVEA
jgi:putative phosphoesterase